MIDFCELNFGYNTFFMVSPYLVSPWPTLFSDIGFWFQFWKRQDGKDKKT